MSWRLNFLDSQIIEPILLVLWLVPSINIFVANNLYLFTVTIKSALRFAFS